MKGDSGPGLKNRFAGLPNLGSRKQLVRSSVTVSDVKLPHNRWIDAGTVAVGSLVVCLRYRHLAGMRKEIRRILTLDVRSCRWYRLEGYRCAPLQAVTSVHQRMLDWLGRMRNGSRLGLCGWELSTRVLGLCRAFTWMALFTCCWLTLDGKCFAQQRAWPQAGNPINLRSEPRRLPTDATDRAREIYVPNLGRQVTFHQQRSPFVRRDRAVRPASVEGPIQIERASNVLPQPTMATAQLPQGYASENLGAGDRQTGRLAGPSFAFNFRNAPWDVVLRNFAREMRMPLHLATTPEGTFSYFDENYYSTDEAIDIFNDHLMSKGAILIRHDNKLSLATADGGIPDEWIPYYRHDELGYIGRNALATVLMPVDRWNPSTVVSEIQPLLSSVGKIQVLANSNRIVVTDTGTYLRRVHELLYGAGLSRDAVKSHVFRLRHADPQETAKAINDFFQSKRAPVGVGGSGPPQVNKVVPAPRSLIVHGTLQELTEIQALIQRLDAQPAQVLIQALLVEVQLGNTEEFGVELGIQDSVLFDRSILDNIRTITETLQDGSLRTTTQTVLSSTATPGFNFNNQPLGLNSVASPNTIGGQALSNFGVGRVNGDLGFGGLVLSAGSESVSILLRALSAKFQTDVLSRPQVRAIDNKEALIQIGQQVPVVDGVSVTAVGSANPVIRQDKAGIILRVTPKISPNGSVMIDVMAEKSAFQLAPGTGVPIFLDSTNGNVIEAPVKDITTANTTVNVDNGQTIVLGGMITKDVSTVERKVPCLGSIPLIGRLFRFDLQQTTRRELLIFLTPKVISGVDHNEHLVDDEMSRMCFPHEHTAQLHPEVLSSRPNAPYPISSKPAYQHDAYTTDGELIPTDQPIWTNAPGDWLPLTRWLEGPASLEHTLSDQ